MSLKENISEMEAITCKICGNREGNSLYTAKEMMYGLRDEFRYVQCKQCECLQIVEVPVNLSKYYPENYYSFKAFEGKKFKGVSGGLQKKKYEKLVMGSGAIKEVAEFFTGQNSYFIFNDLNITKQTSILDVGCGNGMNFLYALAEIGFKNVMGCDPFLKEAIQYANGLNIKKASISEVQGVWDIITYHHSFEHVPDPLEQLKNVVRLLKPGGVCVIRIPTASSYAWEHYKVNWAQLDAPRHLFLHSVKSMQLLGQQTGLKLTKTVFDSTHFQFSGSENYIKDIPLNQPREKGFLKMIARKWKKRQYAKMARKLNSEGRGDQAAFFFAKE